MKFLLAMHGQFMVHGSSLCCIVHCALCVGGGRGKRQEGVEPARPECVEKVPAISEAPANFQTEEQCRFSHVDSDVDLYGANF
jgi:hypothetical protein